MNTIAKLLTSVATSSAKSLLSGGIKKTVSNLIKKHTAKKPEQIEKEIIERLGYATSHYRLDRDQNIIFKSSPVFFHEWLSQSSSMKDKIVRDEENGSIFVNGTLLNNQTKMEIINSFVKATGVQSPAINSHFEAALKLIDPTDHVGSQFKQFFGSWVPGTPSVIDGWLEGCFGKNFTSDVSYANMIFHRWIIGAANRIVNPGSSLDGCLILKGKPNAGKTQHWRKIMPSPFDARTGEIYCDVKDAAKTQEQLLGRSIGCLDELSVMDHPATVEVLKQLLTSQHINVRLAWRRSPESFAMRAAFCGTTNRERFITDKGLSRRCWVIELNDNCHLDFAFLENNRHSLWEEAIYLVGKGETCFLSLAEQKLIEEHNEKFMLLTN